MDYILSPAPCRQSFRLLLTKARSEKTPKGNFPRCAICGEPILRGGEIHEWLITRAFLRDKSRFPLLETPENSVLVCPQKCNPSSGRGNEKEFANCARSAVRWCGEERIMSYIDFVASQTKVIGGQARRDFINILEVIRDNKENV